MRNKAEIAAAISEKKKKEAELKNKQKAELSKMAYQRMIQTNEVFLTRFYAIYYRSSSSRHSMIFK